jgi:probable rRNA maturation factor
MIIFRKRIPGSGERGLVRFAARAQRAAGLSGEVNVLLTGNRQLREYNVRFRGKRAPTDVLSFPAIAPANGLAGDIAISVDLAEQNAGRLGHTAAEEIKILILHGLLHLAGYDHEGDQGEMAEQEQRLRQQLGLPVGLIERSGHGVGMKRKALTAKAAKYSQRARRKNRTKNEKRRVSRKAR